MKTIKLSLIASAILLVVPFINVEAASTPTLTLSNNTGTTGSVIVSVTNADPNAAINFYYYSTTNGVIQEVNIGTTNSSGQFWTAINTATYNINSNNSVYVTVDGAPSTSMSWPYTNTTSSTSGTLSLSQTSVVLPVGQSTSVTLTNSSGSFYISNNSNPSIINTSISGNQILITATNNGSSVITVCTQGNSSQCGSVYVAVNSNNAQPIVFNQNNVSVAVGQTTTVSVSGGTGIYSILNNSNSNVIQSTISGSIVSLYGESSSGSDTITICSTDISSCGIINATIGTNSSTGITFSQTNPTIPSNQITTITIYGGTGSYTVSSNPNSNIVQANISNSVLTLYGTNYGTDTLTVCSTSGSCGTITVTVSSGGSGGTLSLSQTSLNLLIGQAVSITISGGTEPYSIVQGSSASIAASTLNGNVMTVTGINTGSTNIEVCSAGGGCTSLSVSVNSTTSNNPLTLSQNNISLYAGQSGAITISSGNNGYYVSGNTSPTVATVTINGSTVNLTANNQGNSTITICQTSGQCASLYVTVTGTSPTTTTSSLTLNPVISVGQTLVLSITGGSGSYYLSTTPTTPFTANVNGSNLSLTGVTPGLFH